MNASVTTLDHHGRMAMAWWSTHQPDQMRQIADPIAFYRQISDAVKHQIDETQAHLQRRLPARQNYLDQVAAVRLTLIQAEELVLNEWFPIEGGSGRLPD